MKKTVEAVGKTINDAINAALTMIGAERDDVTVEVLEKPKSGFLGIGGTQAKVSVTYEVADEEPPAVTKQKTPAAAQPEKKAGPAGSEEKQTAEQACKFLEGLLLNMGSSAAVCLDSLDSDSINISFTGTGLGMLIGRRGDTLNAIQHLTNLVVNKGREKRIRVCIDTENYRAKREETLEQLAKKTALKAIKYRRSFTLEPMNAYERHVIHMTLQEMNDIKTFSTGTEPSRRIVIAYAPGGIVAPYSHHGGQKRSYNNSRPMQRSDGRDGHNNRGRSDRREKH